MGVAGSSGMDLTVILGPMKGGKSLEMISLLSPLEHAGIPHRIYQSARHGRDTAVTSRSGGSLQTVKVHSLAGAADGDVQWIGVDEIHMFTADDIAELGVAVRRGVKVVVAGIDLDHRGQLFAPVRALFELAPERVIYRRAVCDVCRSLDATHTQVLEHGKPFIRELAPSTPLPDDGTYSYEARCRRCVVLP
ncbi:thymidine kinase [Actinoplanes derwentensis]|uniref:Thymidine kinase n=2 Tax=Actinoplanes derwentensis TaxID=113562 RepID=A0A1H1TAF0_9ACTN|nr:thymidine kinase [Actinoplanes derwentensis]SDS57210.1 thymidine kinase [Actinoplanes derwentensis]